MKIWGMQENFGACVALTPAQDVDVFYRSCAAQVVRLHLCDSCRQTICKLCYPFRARLRCAERLFFSDEPSPACAAISSPLFTASDRLLSRPPSLGNFCLSSRTGAKRSPIF